MTWGHWQKGVIAGASWERGLGRVIRDIFLQSKCSMVAWLGWFDAGSGRVGSMSVDEKMRRNQSFNQSINKDSNTPTENTQTLARVQP